MTTSSVAYTNLENSSAAGNALGATITEELQGHSPDALIVFASSRHNYHELLKSLKQACHPRILVGCSSAGEFISGAHGESSASAIALKSNDLHFSVGVGHNLRAGGTDAAAEIVASFDGDTGREHLFRSALVLTDALAGRTDELIEHISLLTSGAYTLFGGGAGDDAKFLSTHVFVDTEAITDAAVALEILSDKPLGVGVSHGWSPKGELLRVTEAEGMRLISINAAPAVEAFQEYAETIGQPFDTNAPLPFFLHNILGIETSDGYKLRVPLAVNPDGSITCAADIPSGATIRIMGATNASSANAAEEATRAALQQLNGHQAGVALFFDCVATRLRMGQEFGLEIDTIEKILDGTKYAGCNTYGQVARAQQQFSGFHNCTAVVCIIPA